MDSEKGDGRNEESSAEGHRCARDSEIRRRDGQPAGTDMADG